MNEAEDLFARVSNLEKEVKELRTLIEHINQTRTLTDTPARNFDPKNTVSRFYDPPNEIRGVGRILPFSDSFSSLSSHCGENEVIIGCFMNKGLANVASHIHSQDRLNEIYEGCLKEEDGSYAPIEFFAVDKKVANEKMDPKIP